MLPGIYAQCWGHKIKTSSWGARTRSQGFIWTRMSPQGRYFEFWAHTVGVEARMEDGEPKTLPSIIKISKFSSLKRLRNWAKSFLYSRFPVIYLNDGRELNYVQGSIYDIEPRYLRSASFQWRSFMRPSHCVQLQKIKMRNTFLRQGHDRRPQDRTHNFIWRKISASARHSLPPIPTSPA